MIGLVYKISECTKASDFFAGKAFFEGILDVFQEIIRKKSGNTQWYSPIMVQVTGLEPA